MRAAILYGKHDLRVEDRPVPVVGNGEVLIQVSHCGICGSDVHSFNGMQTNIHNRPPGPRVLGHEFSGVVVDIGVAVTTCRSGDRVTCIPWVTCGSCAYCRRGIVNHCVNKTMVGGGMAEYALAPQGAVYRLPDGVSMERAALAEPLSCCIWAMDLAQVASGSTAVIVGAGTMGLLLLVLTRHGGAVQTVVSEPNALRRDLAARLGATMALDPRSQDVASVVAGLTDGVGADVAFEAVGHQATVADALRSVRNGGTVIIVGVADPADLVPLSPFDVYKRELTIRGCFTRRHSFDRAVRSLAHLDLDPIISEVLPLEAAGTAMEKARLGQGAKLMVTPGRQ